MVLERVLEETTESLKMHASLGRAWTWQCLDACLPLSHYASRSITKASFTTRPELLSLPLIGKHDLRSL